MSRLGPSSLHRVHRAQPLGARDPHRPVAVDPDRRAESRDRHARYYAVHPARRAAAFDLVDAAGRRYTVADGGVRAGLSHDTVGLDVREVKGEPALDEVTRARGDLTLLDPATGATVATATVATFGLREPLRRTWRITVRGLDPATVAALVAARDRPPVPRRGRGRGRARGLAAVPLV